MDVRRAKFMALAIATTIILARLDALASPEMQVSMVSQRLILETRVRLVSLVFRFCHQLLLQEVAENARQETKEVAVKMEIMDPLDREDTAEALAEQVTMVILEILAQSVQLARQETTADPVNKDPQETPPNKEIKVLKALPDNTELLVTLDPQATGVTTDIPETLAHKVHPVKLAGLVKMERTDSPAVEVHLAVLDKMPNIASAQENPRLSQRLPRLLKLLRNWPKLALVALSLSYFPHCYAKLICPV